MPNVCLGVELELQPLGARGAKVGQRIGLQTCLHGTRQAEVEQIVRMQMGELAPRHAPRRATRCAEPGARQLHAGQAAEGAMQVFGGAHRAYTDRVIPPSTRRFCPVIYPALSDTRNAISSDTSSILP